MCFAKLPIISTRTVNDFTEKQFKFTIKGFIFTENNFKFTIIDKTACF